jgi:L-fuculose-phosphate aldolase
MQADRQMRKQVIDTARLLHTRGWVANHDGNITARVAANRYLATPTATSKGSVHDGNLIEVDGAGNRLSGTARPFGELGLHLAVYERRPDVHAVVHAHPPHATAIACSAENPIERPFIAEAVVSIGPVIPKLPFAAPGDEAVRALAPAIEHVDAVLLANHGVMAWGADIEQAYLRLELVEHLARIALLARPLGGVVPLPDAALPRLLQARARAGLGRAADAAANHPLARPMAAPAAHAAPAIPATGPAGTPGREPPARDDLVRIIREELQRAIGGRSG